MRSILFKAKKLSDGKWVKGSLVKTPFGIFIEWYEDSICNKREVNPSTVCQFTGAKDCDGTSIYEHDLLRSEKTDSTYEVVWNQGNSSFSLINTEVPVLYPTNTMGRMLHNRRLKVVGNKFDKEK